MSNQKQLNEKQVKILLAVANAEDGLTKQAIMQVWGCDGTNVDHLRFTRDWDGLCSEQLWSFSDLLKGPCTITGDPPDKPSRFFLSQVGRDYLIDNHII